MQESALNCSWTNIFYILCLPDERDLPNIRLLLRLVLFIDLYGLRVDFLIFLVFEGD